MKIAGRAALRAPPETESGDASSREREARFGME